MPQSLRVTVHRGSHQIGGSCVEIATNRHRLLIDAGAPLDHSTPPELPPVAGVSLPGTPPDAVLLSHAHADHSGLLGQLPPTVPVYLTTGTSKMLLAGEVFCRQKPLRGNRLRTLVPGHPEPVGNMMVTAVPVDHSIFGAVAFLIEANGRRVLYSGDLRLHGRKPSMRKALIEAVGKGPLDLLLIEGTHLSRSLDAVAMKESALEDQIHEHIVGAPSLVLAFLSPQHLDRLVGFYKATRRAGRAFVIDFYAAFVMHLLRSEARIPDPANGSNLRVYFPKSQRDKVPKVEQRLSRARIEMADVLAQPECHVLLCRPSMIGRDLRGKMPGGTLGIYSMWHGYLEKDEWQQTQRTIAEANGTFVECHTSGHADVPSLLKLIRDLNPRRIVPIHTERPEAMEEFDSRVEVAKDGKVISL